MTDALESLRLLNPVEAETLEIPATVALRALAREPRRTASQRPRRRALAVVALGALGAVLLLADGGNSSDLAARAYAATSGGSVLHWRTGVSNFSGGRRSLDQRKEGWYYRGVSHQLDYDLPHGQVHITDDQRITPAGERTWVAIANDYLTGPPPAPHSHPEYPDGDPLAAFRTAYREKLLTPLGGGRYRVTFKPDPRTTLSVKLSVIYDLDPRTALPRRLTIEQTAPASVSLSGRPHRQDNRTVFQFSVYEQLAPTAANLAKLALLPHPGAGPSNVPARRYFKALRTGKPPQPDDRKPLASLAANMSRFKIDASAIRVLRPRVWLMPGRGYACIAVDQGAGSIAAGCSTTTRAAAHGVSIGAVPGGITLAVPDTARLVQARLPHHPWRTFPINHGVVRLPSLGYHWRFLP